MLFFYICLGFGFDKKHLIRANDRNFPTLLKQADNALVLISHPSAKVQSKQIETVLHNLLATFSSSILFLVIDASKSPSLIRQYQITQIPSLIRFHKGKFHSYYLGKISENDIKIYLNNILDPHPEIIHNIFELYRFQHRNFPNVLISSTEFDSQVNLLASNFSGIAQIGILDKSIKDLPQKLKLPPIQVYNPITDIYTNLNEISFEKISDSLQKSKWEIISFLDSLNSKTDNFLFVAIYDLQNSAQREVVNNRFSFIKEKLKKGGYYIPMCVIDINIALQITQTLGLIRFTHPLFCVCVKHPQFGYSFNPFTKGNPDPRAEQSPLDLLAFVKGYIAPDDISILEADIEIPRMFADEFVRKALDPNHDVLMLMASPKMEKYSLGILNFKILIQLFKPYNKIKFYEFDPTTEHVNGLQIPESPDPQISVWGAGNKKNGSTFNALYDIHEIMKALYSLLDSQFSDAQKKQINQKLEKIYQDLNNALNEENNNNSNSNGKQEKNNQKRKRA